MKRRSFIQHSGLAVAGGLLIPSFLKAAGNLPVPGFKRLVIVQMSGGVDGLNLAIPFQQDPYYKLRPVLALPKDKVLPLSGELALHPAFSNLRRLYDSGELSVIQAVGYPNPNHSHFRSMDIWHTASASDSYLSTGWLGRFLDTDGCTVHSAIEMDNSLSMALQGENRSGTSMRNLGSFERITNDPLLRQLSGQPVMEHPIDNKSYLYKVLAESQQSASYILGKTKGQPQVPAGFPNHPFGQQLGQVYQCIAAGLDTRIYYTSLGSFDTHVNQLPTHERLFAAMDQSLGAFADNLKKQGLWKDTLVMTFSEFGRRVAQNQSNGTDHGEANPMLLMGGALPKPGILTPVPNLEKLDNGDVPYQVDFRSVYAEVIQRWLQGDASAIVPGKYPETHFLV